jgi:ElaB/YqjD/DUF883 family membrane-anchored ribosome-binding protein
MEREDSGKTPHGSRYGLDYFCRERGRVRLARSPRTSRKEIIMDNKSKTEDLKDTAQDAMENLQETGEDLQNRMGEYWETGKERASEYARATDRAIRENPYPSLGIALGIGLIFGMLLNRGSGYRNED